MVTLLATVKIPKYNRKCDRILIFVLILIDLFEVKSGWFLM